MLNRRSISMKETMCRLGKLISYIFYVMLYVIILVAIPFSSLHQNCNAQSSDPTNCDEVRTLYKDYFDSSKYQELIDELETHLNSVNPDNAGSKVII